MVTIEKCSEYNVRAMKSPNFKNKSHGYNFAYPVMNTIDICDLFISGGTTEVSMNGKSKSTFAFDMESKTLTITERGNAKTYTIDDSEELGEAMIKHFEEHKDEVMQKTLETNLKKSQAKIGNQYAKKDENIKESPKLETNEDILREYPIDYYNYPEKIKEAVANNVKDSCDLDFYLELYKKSAGEYFYWFIGNKWMRIMDKKSSSTLEKMGYDVGRAKKEEENILLGRSQY